MTFAEPIHIVWFKRDLRVIDHVPLTSAVQRGAVLPLYIVEPTLLAAPDFAPRHWTFLRASLAELRERLATLGQPLVIRVGEVVDVFEALRTALPLAAIWAHEETGNGLSYTRDRAVRRWARTQRVPFHEIPQHGVVRRLSSRDGWDEQWEARMRQPLVPTPAALRPLPELAIGLLPTHADLGLAPDLCATQPAGEQAGLQLASSFFNERGVNYQRAMSSPLTAATSCSRLSPHLAYGTVSLRWLVQQVRQQQYAFHNYGLRPDQAPGDWKRTLTAFESRLHWHCHFMQKLEDEPALEFQNFARVFDGMRENAFDATRFATWAAGQTGYPLIDACMRSLIATGWINFRMRAMLTSFAAHQLWLHWREPALHLARQFTDYEPGIHYCQIQMQSGTTGNKTLRIYNPTKQAQDHDPNGVFIRRWLPELSGVPDSFIHAPWLMPTSMQHESNCQIGKHYPAPIVQHDEALQFAREQIARVRRSPGAQAEFAAVYQRHGSRRHVPQRRRSRKPQVQATQLSFNFESLA
jgi:deoxyribodipyrimidine photo-lyase